MTGKLHFNSCFLDLIDNLPVPASVIINNREYFRNRRMKEGDINIHQLIDSLKTPDAPSAEHSINICGRFIRTRVMRYNDLEFVIPEISFNSTPGYLAVTGCRMMNSDFTECIRHLNSMAGINKVLLVDDNPAIIETYASILELLGYKIYPYTDPLAALNSAAPASFDLLISDYDMPGMNGFDLCRNFYQQKPGFPVIIISGSVEFQNSRVENRSGSGYMISFINKPVGIDELRGAIEIMEFFYKFCMFAKEAGQINAMW